MSAPPPPPPPSSYLDTEQAAFVRSTHLILDVTATFLRESFVRHWDARYPATPWGAGGPAASGKLLWRGSSTFSPVPGTVDLTEGESEAITTHDLTSLGIAQGERLRLVTAGGSQTEDRQEDRKRGVDDPTFAVGRGQLTLKEVPDAAWLPGGQRVVCRARTQIAGWFDDNAITFTLAGGSKKVTVECEDPSAQVEPIFDQEATVTFLEPDDGKRSEAERSHDCTVQAFGKKCTTSAGSLWLDMPPEFLKSAKGGKPKVSLGCTIERQDEPRMEVGASPLMANGFQKLATTGDPGHFDVSYLTFLLLNSSHELLQANQAKIDAAKELRQLRNEFYGHVAAARLKDAANMLPAIQDAMRVNIPVLLDNRPGVLADLNKAIKKIDGFVISEADIKGQVDEAMEKVKKQAAAEKAVLEAEVAAQKAKKEKYRQVFNVVNARPADASDSYSDGAVERTAEELANAAKICREMFGEEFRLANLTGNLKGLRVAGDMAKEELISSKAAYMLKRLKEEWKAKHEGKSFSQSSSTRGAAGGTTLTREEQAEIVRRAEEKFRAWVVKRCGGACQARGGAQHQPPSATPARPIDPALRGGFGAVFLAEDTGMTATGRQPCVVKCPLSRDDKDWRKTGLRECRILNVLPSHPNIVGLIHIEDKDGVPLVTMEHCELGSIKTINSPPPVGLRVGGGGGDAAGGDGGDQEESKASRIEDSNAPAALSLTAGTKVALGAVLIKHRLHARHVFEARAAGVREGLRGAALLDVMIQVMHGLNHLRIHGVIHQDIKPDNIVVTSAAFYLVHYGYLLHALRKDYNGAEAMYKRAIEADPNHAAALSNYGHLLQTVRKDYDGAEAMCKRAIEANPNHAAALINYGHLLENVRKDYDGAEAMYKRAIEADPNNATALSNYGLLLYNVRKDYDGAEAMYKRAIEADPNNAPVLSDYATLLHTVRKDYDGAEAMYKRAIEADPNNAFALYNYGLLLLIQSKDYEGAEARLTQAIEGGGLSAEGLPSATRALAAAQELKTDPAYIKKKKLQQKLAARKAAKAGNSAAGGNPQQMQLSQTGADVAMHALLQEEEAEAAGGVAGGAAGGSGTRGGAPKDSTKKKKKKKKKTKN
eukprot:g521.t1